MPTEGGSDAQRRDVDKLKTDLATLKRDFSEFKIELRAAGYQRDEKLQKQGDQIEALEDVFACSVGAAPSHPLSVETRNAAINVGKHSHARYEGNVAWWQKFWNLAGPVVGAGAGLLLPSAWNWLFHGNGNSK